MGSKVNYGKYFGHLVVSLHRLGVDEVERRIKSDEGVKDIDVNSMFSAAQLHSQQGKRYFQKEDKDFIWKWIAIQKQAKRDKEEKFQEKGIDIQQDALQEARNANLIAVAANASAKRANYAARLWAEVAILISLILKLF